MADGLRWPLVPFVSDMMMRVASGRVVKERSLAESGQEVRDQIVKATE